VKPKFSRSKEEEVNDREKNKGNSRIKILRSVLIDGGTLEADNKTKGCLTVVKFNLGPQEFKS
jgi:hypothetical protein